MNHNILGKSLAATVLSKMHEEGHLTSVHWRKIARAYNQFSFNLRDLWLSELEERLKRKLDILMYQEALDMTHKLDVPVIASSHLRTVLSTKHKEYVSIGSRNRRNRHGLGNRTHREA